MDAQNEVVRHEDEFLREVAQDMHRLARWLPWERKATLLIISVLAGALAFKTLQPAPPAQVVAVDHGKILGFAQVFRGDSQLGVEIIEDQLRHFIESARTVSTDTDIETTYIDGYYAMARGQAKSWMDQLKESPDNPLVLGHNQNYRSAHDIQLFREQTAGAYRAHWLETMHPRQGQPYTTEWEATLAGIVGPASLRTELNPLPLMVMSFDPHQVGEVTASTRAGGY
jgi:type IV secretory pathway TrbF-like protein